MFIILDLTEKDLIAFKAEGKIEEKDYNKIVPMLEKTVREYGHVDLYVEVGDIEGMEPAALWKDLKAYFSNIGKFRKVAVVGQGKMEEIVSKVSDPFMKADVRYFPVDKSLEAREWVQGV